MGAGQAFPSLWPTAPSLQSSSGQLWPSHPWYRMLWEEFLVAAFEDIHLRVVQAGVVVSCTVPFPDKPAPRAAREGVQGRIHMSERDARTCWFEGLPRVQVQSTGMSSTRQETLG